MIDRGPWIRSLACCPFGVVSRGVWYRCVRCNKLREIGLETNSTIYDKNSTKSGKELLRFRVTGYENARSNPWTGFKTQIKLHVAWKWSELSIFRSVFFQLVIHAEIILYQHQGMFMFMCINDMLRICRNSKETRHPSKAFVDARKRVWDWKCD